MEGTKLEVERLSSKEDLEFLVSGDRVKVKGRNIMICGHTNNKTNKMFFVGKNSEESVYYIEISKKNISIKNKSLYFKEPYFVNHIKNKKSLFYKNWSRALRES